MDKNDLKSLKTPSKDVVKITSGPVNGTPNANTIPESEASNVTTTPVNTSVNISNTPNTPLIQGRREKLTEKYNDEEQVKILQEEKYRLKGLLKDREERLRKLKLVKLYREKNELNNLSELTEKWRTASQEAAQTLYSKLPKPRPPMKNFLRGLNIDEKLIGFDADGDTFG